MENSFGFTEILKVGEILTNENVIRNFFRFSPLDEEEGEIVNLLISKDKGYVPSLKVEHCLLWL